MSANVIIKQTKILSDESYPLKKITYETTDRHGKRQTQEKEVYEKGNAATVFLYNTGKKTVILTRQFRLPAFINGKPDGMLIECCAGMLEDESPEACVKREAVEETGYKAEKVQKIIEAYMSAGSVTELLHFFTAQYNEQTRINEGGGLEAEHEDIEVLELPFERALAMISSGEIKDAKTIMLLQYAVIHQLM